MCNFLSGHIISDPNSKDWGKVFVITGVHHEIDRQDPRLARYDGQLAAWETNSAGTFADGFHITHDSGSMLNVAQRDALKATLVDWASTRRIEDMPGYADWAERKLTYARWEAELQKRIAQREKNDPVNRWLNQTPHGRTGELTWKQRNVHYEQDTIYSYGWWPMARVVDWTAKVALYRDETYSVTTAKHQSYVRWGLRCARYEVFHVADVSSNPDHGRNLTHYEEKIAASLNKADHARDYRDLHMRTANELIEEMDRYCELFGLD